MTFLLLLPPATAVYAQNDDAANVPDYPDMEARIMDESDSKFYYLLNDVFPDAKTADPAGDYFKRKENVATRSIRMRKLFGAGFSKLNEKRGVTIKQARWLTAKNKRRFFVVLFEARAPAKKAFYALAVYSVVRMKVPDMSVYSASKWKWDYIFDLVDAVDPQIDADVELPKGLLAIKDRRGSETFWLLNLRAAAGESFKNYNAVELFNGRMRPLFKDFPTVYNNSDCTRRFEQNFEIFRNKAIDKTILSFEVVFTSKIWTNNDCQARETFGDLREIESYQPRWQIRSRYRRLVRFQSLTRKVEKIEGANLPGVTGVPECDDYIEKYEICLRSKLYRGAASRAETEKYLRILDDSFKKSFAGATVPRDELVAGCRKANEAARESPVSFGCEW